MPRLKLTIAYEGTDFCGWQIQAGREDQPTIQGAVETVVSRICGTKIRAHGSGRTDSGVHALGQVVHMDIPDEKSAVDWGRALNALLPDAIVVVDAAYVPDSFHSRYSALSKTYAYSLWLNDRYVLPQRRHFVWKTGRLDLAAMDAAAEALIGEHDFKSFQNTGTPVKSTVRTITDISRSQGLFAEEVVWRFTADGFLKQMVRNLTGLLVAVGRGQFAPDDVRKVIAAEERSAYRYPTAPPQGLCMEVVRYAPFDGED